MAAKKTAVFGIYTTRTSTEEGVEALQNGGFPISSISALVPENFGANDIAATKATKAPEAALAGAGAGAALGGTLGLLAGIGALAIPGVGPLIAAGPIVATLAGLGAGGAVGGLVGALIGLGIPEYEAKRYEGRVQKGGILLSVHCDSSDQVKKAKELLKRTGAEDVSSAAEVSSDAKTEPRRTVVDAEASDESDYELFRPDFRRHFESNFAETGATYDQYDPAYRYGYTLGRDNTYVEVEWGTIETRARADWERRRAGTWDRFKDAIRYSLDRVRGRH